MISIRKADERGTADFGWLRSRHSFSFGRYHDPRHMGLGPLRVINDDRMAPGGGFDAHPHQDMEIVTYVLEGALEHADSLGTGSVIRPGDVQRMSAGSGIRHSEHNHSAEEPVHFLQIWLLPEARGLAPSYARAHFPATERRGRLRLVASRDGRLGSLVLHQDADIHAGLFARGESATHAAPGDRKLWLQVARGSVRVNDAMLAEGDGAAIEAESGLRVEGLDDAEILLFDMAG